MAPTQTILRSKKSSPELSSQKAVGKRTAEVVEKPRQRTHEGSRNSVERGTSSTEPESRREDEWGPEGSVNRPARDTTCEAESQSVGDSKLSALMLKETGLENRDHVVRKNGGMEAKESKTKEANEKNDTHGAHAIIRSFKHSGKGSSMVRHNTGVRDDQKCLTTDPQQTAQVSSPNGPSTPTWHTQPPSQKKRE